MGKSQMIEDSDSTDTADKLVGRFLRNFATLERAIDEALVKLLKLEPQAGEIVLANMPFQKKVETLFASEKEFAAAPGKVREKTVADTRVQILTLNDQRNIAAHCSFDGTDDGRAVQFRQVVAKRDGLKISDVVWTVDDVERSCARVADLVRDVKELVETMKPYEPSLEFYDLRDSDNATLL